MFLPTIQEKNKISLIFNEYLTNEMAKDLNIDKEKISMIISICFS